MIAGVAPYGAEGLDFLDGMGEDNHIEFGKALAGEHELRPYLEAEAAAMSESTPEGLREVLDSLLGDEDRSVLTGGFAEHFIESDDHGFAQGIDGWLDDDVAFTQPWGFALEDINRPVLLLQGEDDRFVPASHGRWLADRVAGVDARITSDDGHLTLFERHMRAVNEWLLAHS